MKSLSTAVLLAATASAAAGLVHAAAAGTHTGASELVTLFAACAGVQVLVAGALLIAPTRASLLTLAGANVIAVVAWGLSRTTGLPWPELLNEAEDVGTQDLVAAALGAVAALSAGVALAAPRWAVAKAAPTAFAGAVCMAALALAVPGMAAEHAHDEASHDHSHPGDEVAADDGHSHDEDDGELAAGDATGGAGEPDGPVISLDDVRLTSSQRSAAEDLIDRTTDGMQALPDVAALEAAGYASIGDSVTGFEHFINIGYIADGIDLDPNRIESVVLTVDPDGTKTVASAMYILDFGKTMADVPDIAGELTTWHDHQNLCWEGARVVAVLDGDGNCPRGTFRPTPPMLHVWLPGQEPECGPFAGIEGSHGSDCHGDHDD